MLVFPPDYTLLVQLVSFFVLLIVLNHLLFKPFSRLLGERETHTEGAEALAERMRRETEALREKVDMEVAEARRQAMAEAEAIRRRARDQETALFEKAKNDAGARLAELRKGIEEERGRAAAALRSDADALAREMVQAILGSARAA